MLPLTAFRVYGCIPRNYCAACEREWNLARERKARGSKLDNYIPTPLELAGWNAWMSWRRPAAAMGQAKLGVRVDPLRARV